jgi:hypothetical protein
MKESNSICINLGTFKKGTLHTRLCISLVGEREYLAKMTDE